MNEGSASLRPTRPDGRLRVALIGCGDISLYHLTAWQRAGAEIVALCDHNRDRATARAEQFGVPGIAASLDELFATYAFDALDVTTWRDSHPAIVRRAISEGCDVICQKPLAPTLAEARDLVAEAEGRIRLMVNENRRFAPNYRLIRQWIDDGHVGTVQQVHMTMHRSGYLPDENGRRAAVARSPRMADEPRLLIAETLIHQLDVLRSLLGEMNVIAARLLRTEPDMPGETLASIMLETRDRAPVIVSGSFVAPGSGADVADRLELIGRRSSIIMDGMDIEARGAFRARASFDAAHIYQACFDAAARHFTRALAAGTPFPESAASNLETLRLVEDAYRFAEQVS